MLTVNFLDVKYWERKFVDLWSIVHFNTGVVYAFLPFGLGLPYYQGFILILLVAGVWEYIEILKIPKNIRESNINKITDIAVALIGFTLVYTFMPAFKFDPALFLLVAVPYSLFAAALAWVAWNAYDRYSGGPE